MNKKCKENCSLIKYENGRFFCKFYEEELDMMVITNDDEDDEDAYIYPVRCNGCAADSGDFDDEEISVNIKKIRNEISTIEDVFYTFSDDMKESLSNIYRSIKLIEGKEDVIK